MSPRHLGNGVNRASSDGVGGTKIYKDSLTSLKLQRIYGMN
ncbi:hypothetical protein [Paenibacillus lautus]